MALNCQQATREDLDTVVGLWRELARDMERYDPFYPLAPGAGQAAVPYFVAMLEQDDAYICLPSSTASSPGLPLLQYKGMCRSLHLAGQ